jgi:hypothetical protein
MTTYGNLNPLETQPRYTTLAAVKRQMGVTDTSFDAEITQSIVAMEYMIDVFMNRSFPDTGIDPEIDGVPLLVAQAALLGSIEVVKLADAPSGVAGADEFIGQWDMSQTATRRALNTVKPMLVGFRGPDAYGVA